MRARSRLDLLAGGLALGVLACSGPTGDAPPALDAGLPEDAGGGDAAIAPDAGDPRAGRIPAAPPSLAVSSTCTALRPGERALAVDPEGHLWLADTSSAEIGLRVLDAWGERPERRYRTRYQAIAAFLAESATTASVLADGEAWHFEDGIRVRISAPFRPAPDASACGSLRDQAFVVTGGEIHQRLDDRWVRFEGVRAALGPRPRLLPRDGACFGASDAVWLASGRLATWALGPSTLTRTSTLAGATSPVARGDQLLALADGDLLVGPAPFRRLTAAAPVRALSAGGDYAWLVHGRQLLRFDGAGFERADVRIAPADITLHAFAAGGVWTTTDRSACAIAPARTLRVAGLRTGRRRRAAQIAFGARASDPTADVRARLGERELAPSRVEDGWLRFEAEVELGWQVVRLAVAPGSLTRTLTVKRVPQVTRSWAADIRPIYRAHCAGSACHVTDSAGAAPDLSVYRAWVARAAAIERRVVDQQTMPPAASRRPEWGMDEIRAIEQWLEGGLQP